MASILFLHILLLRKIKLRSNTNLLIWKLKHSKNQLNLRNVINRFDSIYTEISEANANHFSNYLLNIWLIFGTFICVLLFPAFYGKMDFYIRFTFLYVAFQSSCILLFIINICSSVYSEALKPYQLLNSCMANSNGKQKKLRICTRIKVFVDHYLNYLSF